MSGSVVQKEFEFTLPKGYADDEGTLHRDGVMRLATAADEIKPLRDPRVQSNSAYLTVILLSRVVTDLGSLSEVTPHVIENLFVADLNYLQELYKRINLSEGGRQGCSVSRVRWTVSDHDLVVQRKRTPNESDFRYYVRGSNNAKHIGIRDRRARYPYG